MTTAKAGGGPGTGTGAAAGPVPAGPQAVPGPAAGGEAEALIRAARWL
jgi:hypothetical protein